MRILKRDYKNLMILEAGYIYCKRHDINYDTFESVFIKEGFDCKEGSEFDNICKDLRFYKYHGSHKLIEITDDEYEMCVDMFGEMPTKIKDPIVEPLKHKL